MKKLYALIFPLAFSGTLFSQVVFQSDLSSWSAGDPTDWMGSATNVTPANVVEQTVGVTYGTSMASIINTTTSHQRFTTQNVTVTAGETYLIEMWVAAQQGQLRTGFYDATNAAYGTYNSYVDLSTTSAGSLVLVTQEVTVPASCTSGQFILSFHSTNPATAGAPFFIGVIVDSVAVSVTTPTPTPVVSIYDIQYTTAPSGDSPEVGNTVTTYGIVTGVIGFGADADRFFIQDGDGAWNGIYVYENGYTVVLGDSVEVTGTVTEYFGLTEISSVTNVTVINSGNAQPNAAVVTTSAAADEQYECVLVQVTDAQCNNADAGFGQWTVNDGSGDRLIDDQIFAYTPVLGNYYNVTGVTFLSFSEVKIYPRIAADITVTGFVGIEQNSSIQIYPNPASQVVNINIPSNALYTIYAMNGEVIASGIGATKLDVSNMTSGIYTIQVIENSVSSNYRLVVE